MSAVTVCRSQSNGSGPRRALRHGHARASHQLLAGHAGQGLHRREGGNGFVAKPAIRFLSCSKPTFGPFSFPFFGLLLVAVPKG